MAGLSFYSAAATLGKAPARLTTTGVHMPSLQSGKSEPFIQRDQYSTLLELEQLDVGNKAGTYNFSDNPR